MSALSATSREVWAGTPEQCFAVECMLRSAANARHVAERAEMWDLTPKHAETLRAAAQASEDAADLLLIALCPTADTYRTMRAELIAETRV